MRCQNLFKIFHYFDCPHGEDRAAFSKVFNLNSVFKKVVLNHIVMLTGVIHLHIRTKTYSCERGLSNQLGTKLFKKFIQTKLSRITDMIKRNIQ